MKSSSFWDTMLCSPVSRHLTDVLEEYIASIFRAEATCFMLFSYLSYFSTLNMEVMFL
jgi:hypothetical protein